MATPSVLTTTVSGKLCIRSRRSISTTNIVSTTAEAVTSALPSAEAVTSAVPSAEAVTSAVPSAEAVTSAVSSAEAVTSAVSSAEVVTSAISSAEAVTPAISSTAASSTDAQLQSRLPPAQQSSLAVQVPPAAQTATVDTQPTSSAVAASSSLSLSPLSSAPVLSQNPGTTNSVSLIISQLAPSSQSLSSSQSHVASPIAFIPDSRGQSAPLATYSSMDSSAPTGSDLVQSILVPTTSSSSPDRLPGRPEQTSFSTAGPTGLVSPVHGSSGPESQGHISSNAQKVNVWGVVGGVVGGLMGMAVVGAVLFLCLRRRRTRETLAAWKQRINEKRRPGEAGEEPSESASFASQVKAPVAGIGSMATAMMLKIRPNKISAQENTNRGGDRNSVSSMYSTRSSVRLQSSSKPPSRLRRQLHSFTDRMAIVKWPKGRMGHRQNSVSSASHSPFSEVVEDPLVRNSSRISNPFLDPEFLRRPTLPNLRTMNPDPSRPSTGMTTPRQAVAEGLVGQQRAPLTPRTPQLPPQSQQVEPVPRIPNPFSDPTDEPEDRTGDATPDWLRRSSHPPSFYTNPPYHPSPSNPFIDLPDFPVPALPDQPTTTYTSRVPFSAYLPNHSRSLRASQALLRPSSARGSAATNSSAFLFGEPGPSRPTTIFTNASFSRATRGKSDPFDLDRPEVLGFGNMSSRKELRASVMRQNSRSNRGGSTPNWVTLDDEERLDQERRSGLPPRKPLGTAVGVTGMAR